jgi:endoglucanase
MRALRLAQERIMMKLSLGIVGVLVQLLSLPAVAARIEHVGFASPDVVEIVVGAGRVRVGTQVPYVKEDGDVVRTQGRRTYLYRDGRKLGVLVGGDHSIFRAFDALAGEPVDAGRLDPSSNYWISSRDDERYELPRHPKAVHRKSGPTNVARTDDWKFDASVEHHLFLVLPDALKPGARYRVSPDGAAIAKCEFMYEPREVRSEAVHVSHLGFHPDASNKLAFLSCWTGSGGGLEYSENPAFQVVSEEGDDVVFSGTARLSKPATAKDEDAYKRNFNRADVYEMDFSALNRPGEYRVCVDGVGCSYPFRIAKDVWERAFVTAARGFFHQRSGIPLGPPHTQFERPRPFHPDDGMKVYASTTRLMDTRNGLSQSDPDNFRNLVAGRTDEIVPDAWGGYMDAGDWDRRIQHLLASLYLLELAECFPTYFRSLSTNIPESGNELPDIVDEALFNLDCYRRMQTPAGGIRGGIESEEHPNFGETSWQESLTVMAYAPGSWSSFYYAGVAARAAFACRALGAEASAGVYEESAMRAMEWAEQDYATLDERPRAYSSRGVEIERMDHDHRVNDARNYAAAELFRLTGDARWHEIFRETTKLNQPDAQLFVWKSHDQRQAPWVYVTTQRDGVDATLRKNCRRAILREADDRLRTQSRTAFRWTKNDWAPPIGSMSVPDTVSLVRAHALTGEKKYLEAAALACQMGLGANPLNLCYTTGLGHRSPRNPLHLDSRHTGQERPQGITVLGPVDPSASNDMFLNTVIKPFCFPEPAKWPIMEAYWDVFWYPMMCEFTVHHPMAYNAYTWGYLAAVTAR